MRRYANDAAINRKARAGTILTFVGFGLLIISLVLSFRTETITTLSLGSALFGMIITQIGVTLTNKWGKRPRVDEIIDASLKGLDASYALFHYNLGANHVLVGPSSTFTLVPCVQDGEITFTDGKWWQTTVKRGKKRNKALKNIGKDAEYEAHSTAKKIHRLLSSEEDPQVTPLLVFLHPDAKLNVNNPSPSAVHHKKLKQYLRKIKGGSITQPFVQELVEKLRL
jgi:hypothetical protein